MGSIDMTSFNLPDLPSPCHDFIPFLAKHPDTSVSDLIRPYKDYDSKVREGFAQHRDHDLLQDPRVNAVPIYAGHADTIKIRARSLDNDVANERYIFPLNSKERKPNGAPAIVHTMKDFRQNFNLFSESSLVDLDWSNVVAAGSSVVTSLLPVPEKYNTSKRTLREYYHEILAPSSDVDLFIYGLDQAAAFEKIKQIETRIRDSILAETTTIRTKNAITIASQYPVRHVQIVARLYKSVSEILTGFDVDCSCFAYDGSQVYGAPRAIAALITQTNMIDLSRRSPSYESRLSKYSHRGFEAYWPLMERDRIDPTIFERSFPRTMGLARLLVLETLPKPFDREQYIVQRRSERGRPVLPTNYYRQFGGNMKDNEPDDIAEWVYEDGIANYHTFTVPYGPKYNAKKIEKLLFMKDLLLNAEWNTKKDRSISLHRHPCFIGNAQSVIHDCCGTCPPPTTEEEREAAIEENKIYVSGDLEFMKDDPGRQTIGSFNPSTDNDWTDMAYIGNTAELCQAICAGDLLFVQQWCMRETSVLDRRDPTGRTPLQLAVQCSSLEIVQCLIENGARIVARLVDGFTALHIAAWRGNLDMVNALLERSEANEEEEATKEERAKAAKKFDFNDKTKEDPGSKHEDTDMGEDDDKNMEDASSDESTTMTEGSFVKIKPEAVEGEAMMDIEDGDPDVYDVNVLAWDSPVSPLHLAILGGHIPVIEILVSKFGADVLLPVKILDDYSKQPSAAILTLVLAAQLPGPESNAATRCLLALGASSAQADMKQHTPVSYAITQGRVDILKELFEQDPIAAQGALSHVIVEGSVWSPAVSDSAGCAVLTGAEDFVKKVLELGAKPQICFEDFLPSYNAFLGYHFSHEDRHHSFAKFVNQPIIEATQRGMPMAAEYLLQYGADMNTLTKDGGKLLVSECERRYKVGTTLLDVVNEKIKDLEKAIETETPLAEPINLEDDSYYLGSCEPGTYQHWQLSKELATVKRIVHAWRQARDDTIKRHAEQKGLFEKRKKLLSLKVAFETLRKNIIERGGRTFKDLHPDITTPLPEQQRQFQSYSYDTTPKPFMLELKFSVPGNQTTMEGKQGAYLKLFEAAWNGDEPTVKDMTMSPDGDRPPLHIAVVDPKGFSPFAIAICRGHLHLAKSIIEIANAQYVPSDNTKPHRRYLINNDANDADVEDDDMSLYSELVDDTFTIENIAALTKTVGSKTPATHMLQWRAEFWMVFRAPELEAKEALGCLTDDGVRDIVNMTDTAQAWDCTWHHRPNSQKSLVDLAIATRDLSLLRFLLRIEQEARLALDKGGDSFHVESLVGPSHFQFALKEGFMEIAGEMIAATGVALPLDHLVEKSGIGEVEKPKYYQGLMLYGKHKREWAQERDNGQRRHRNSLFNKRISEESPILTFAGHANLAAVEWFLSDTPARLYKQYCIENKEDKRLIALSKAHGGSDKAIDDWLHARIDLALHHAIQSDVDSENIAEVITYLVRAIPSTLEAKNDDGLTPLALTFSLGKIHLIPVLLALGADQTARASNGCNLLHLLLSDHTSHVRNNTRKIEGMLSLLDPRLIPEMLGARSSRDPTGLTPLARWIVDGGRKDDVFALLAKHMSGEEVIMLDGSGQRPIHQAIKQHRYTLVATMLHYSPDLLYMENAMGQTPLELAASLYIRYIVDLAPNMYYQPQPPLMEHRDPSEFIPGQEFDPLREIPYFIMTNIIETWRVCKEAAERREGGMTRKLVSVTEAAEVAKRLAERKKRERMEREAREWEPDQGED